MTKDEQARARLVEIALKEAKADEMAQREIRIRVREMWRRTAGFKDPSKGHFCAAGLTWAMETAGLVVPAPGTPARRGAVALLDFVFESQNGHVVARTNGSPAMAQICMGSGVWSRIQPGDIIAWLQNKAPEEWLHVAGLTHAFAHGQRMSMCGKANGLHARVPQGKRCSSCVWETRKGHVALIVAMDDESLTTVGWNEGTAPGRVVKRRLWRDPARDCERWMPKRSATVLWRRPGGLYGIARPVAR